MKRFWTALTFLPVTAAIAWNLFAGSSAAVDAHRRADAVLWPAFISISNDYALNHGALADPGHVDKVDRKDKERFNATCAAFKAWRDAMTEAGY